MPIKGLKVLPNPVFSELPQNYRLSEEQKSFYWENGYLVIKELIDFTSLYSYKQRFLQICKGIVDSPVMIVKEQALFEKNLKPEEYINKLQEILYDDVFMTYGEHPRLLDVISQFIGDDITAIHSMFINKPPGTARHPPHQDLFYFPIRPVDKIIGSWTAVDHVNKDNGCLYVIPKSHKQDILYPHGDVPEAGKLYHGILNEETLAREHARVSLDMAPGDTVLLHPRLLHGSGPNRTQRHRKAITVHFASSACEYVDVRGSVQERLAADVQAAATRRGLRVSYQDIWKYKSKQVKGVRSNL
ncbi:phytanoyl-CoA dioxygenase, peroxisomal-like isoform X2 [Bombyx mandarina]|uniref:phytanoyl-CoA dioxygenase n=1 Tax=Bombyx mandarina TaxID=7092 RepID=A0A6J2KCG6_BOMMA|nr:phytanoyl-CoA dioxygenase, peroxisomal-like isoform X2 [Bombyx mandarina]